MEMKSFPCIYAIVVSLGGMVSSCSFSVSVGSGSVGGSWREDARMHLTDAKRDLSLDGSIVMVLVCQSMSGFIRRNHVYPKIMGSFPKEVIRSLWFWVVPSGKQSQV